MLYSTWRLTLVSFSILLLLAGCATKHVIVVDAINNPGLGDLESYRISNVNSAKEDGVRNALLDGEVVELVKTALSGRALFEAPEGVKPDLLIEVTYGLGEPIQSHRKETRPVYGWTRGEYRSVVYDVVGKDGTVTQKRDRIYIPPRREIVDYQDVYIPIITYEKFLRLNARVNTENSAHVGDGPINAWSVSVNNVNESDDLRMYLPLLAAAAIPYIGENTGEQIPVRLSEEDDDVAFVKSGMGE